MAAQLLRLKLRLLGNSFQRSPWQVIALVLGLAYGAGVAGVASLALFGLRLVSIDTAAPIVIVGGSVIVLGYLVVPLIFGVDDSMDPRKFALFGVNNRSLANGLIVAALIGVPALAIVMIALAQIVTWSREPLAVLVAVMAAIVLVATCVLGSRVSTSLAAFLLSTRRARDATASAGLVLLILLSPVFVLLLNVDWRRDGFDVLDSVATVAGWTPLGAVWSAPAAAADGNLLDAALKLLIALAFAGVLFLAWHRLVAVMLITPQRIAQAKKYRGLGWFRIFPTTQTGMIAARTFTYWGRDARYFVSLLVIPIVPVLMIIPLLVAGVEGHYLALLPVPVAALFLGWSIHNDVAYDSTALWLHVVSDTSGTADRLGRAIPALIVGVPVLVAGAFVSTAVYGEPEVLPSLIGVSLGILFSGLGLSSIMSARFPYPVANPGDSPFTSQQSTATASSLIQSLSFMLTSVLALPSLIFAALGFIYGGNWPWVSFACGILLGLAVLGIGIGVGGHVFRRRSTELLAFSMRN